MAGKILRTLLVEDNPGDAFLLQELLQDVRDMEPSLRHVEQLSDAMALLRDHEFDLMLLDLSLPDVHGVETVIQASAMARDLAIVVLTGLDDEEMALRAMQEGAQDYLVKGKVDGPLLRRSIRYALERKRAEDHVRRLVQEQLARSEAEAAERRSRLMADVSHLLASSLDYEGTLGGAARLVVETWADVCLVDLVQSGNEVRRLAVDALDLGVQPSARPLSLGQDDLVAQVIQSGEALLVADFPGSGRVLRSLSDSTSRIRSVISIPLAVRGRALGAMTFVARHRRFGAEDQAFARELAGRAALAVENVRLHRTREDVLRLVSHDLRTPLTVIRGNLEMLESGDLPKGQVMATLNRATEHMERLLQDLLDATKLDAGTLALSLQRLGVATLLEEVEESLRPVAEGKGLKLRTVDAEPLPFIRADRGRILQVFWNLVGNAFKFTPEGGTITVTAEPVGNEVRFSVADTGCGIAAKDLANVFERFWQGSRTDRRGAGLGLSIAKGLVEAHGGRIWVTSVEGEGTTFSFSIPVAESPVAEPVPTRKRVEPS